MESPDGKTGRVHEVTIVSQNLRIEMLSQDDVQGISDSEIEPETPSVVEQAANLSDAQGPRLQLGHRGNDVVRWQDRVEFPAAEDRSAFHEEVIGNPGNAVSRQKTSKRSATHRVGCQLHSGRGVDDDRCHASPRARTSAKVSAARTAGLAGSPLWRLSNQARKVSALTSSSGFVTTTAGSLGRSAAWRAIPPSYRWPETWWRSERQRIRYGSPWQRHSYWALGAASALQDRRGPRSQIIGLVAEPRILASHFREGNGESTKHLSARGAAPHRRLNFLRVGLQPGGSQIADQGLDALVELPEIHVIQDSTEAPNMSAPGYEPTRHRRSYSAIWRS